MGHFATVAGLLACARLGVLGHATFDARPQGTVQYGNIRVINLLLCDIVAYEVRDTNPVTERVAPHLVLREKWHVSVLPTKVIQ